MTKHLLRLSLCTAALFAVTPVAYAADYEPPPAPEVGWTGPYIGGFVGGTFVEGNYDNGGDPELSGTGGYGGVLGGYLYDFGGIVVGIEADYGWGFDTTAQNRDPSEAVDMEFDGIGTIRGRLGWADDDTLIYATGGYGWIEATLSGLVGPNSVPDDDQQTHEGWVIGGGIEHRLFDSGLSARLEYLYGDFDGADYTLTDGDQVTGTAAVELDNVHIVRAALIYNFGNLW
ncbi:outer membrane protein [Taklimakanibacter lacteus]|uniref:outer membrane protein n=1 Tax=Taklimakanibacter lacteus TaxID=2268456 RepID=UPI000E672F0E